MKKEYVVKNVYRSFVLTSILTALTATLGMLVDNIIVGWCLGSKALGAMSIISPISLILSPLAISVPAAALQGLPRPWEKASSTVLTAFSWRHFFSSCCSAA